MAKISYVEVGENICAFTKMAGKYPPESYAAVIFCHPIGMDIFVTRDKINEIHVRGSG